MKGGYFTALPANRDRLGGLQLLGRLAALQGVTDQCPAFAVLPGASPNLPPNEHEPYKPHAGDVIDNLVRELWEKMLAHHNPWKTES